MTARAAQRNVLGSKSADVDGQRDLDKLADDRVGGGLIERVHRGEMDGAHDVSRCATAIRELRLDFIRGEQPAAREEIADLLRGWVDGHLRLAKRVSIIHGKQPAADVELVDYVAVVGVEGEEVVQHAPVADHADLGCSHAVQYCSVVHDHHVVDRVGQDVKDGHGWG